MKKIYFSFLAFLCAFALSAQTLVGDATTLPSSTAGSTDYQLTPALREQRGAFWNNTQLNLANNFAFSAELNFGTQSGPSTDDHTGGADGIAFVLQSVGTTALGTVGEGMGYGGITNSFAVEMDTWQNLTRNDVPGDHLAFMKNGDVTHNTAANSDADRYLLANLEDGAWHPFTVSWNAGTKVLTATLDGVSRTFTGDVAAVIGTNMVTWGFTSATGSALNQHRIRFLATPNCVPFTVSVSVPALGCSNGNTIYLGYGPQSVTATSSPADPTTTYKWYMVGAPGVVHTGATFSPTMAGSYYVVATRGDCTASNADNPVIITVIDIRCGKDNQDKVNVCHKQNGTHGNGTIGDNAHTLCVSVDAVPAHLAHGDCLGACPETAMRASNKLTVFPNPTTNSVKLNIEAASGDRSEVLIRNAQGNVVERKSVIGNAQPSFDLRKYGTGIFVIQIINGSDIITNKVLVKE